MYQHPYAQNYFGSMAVVGQRGTLEGYFRGSSLAQSAVGRKVIEIYYNNADNINAALDRSPTLRAIARTMLEIIAPMMGEQE